MTPKSIIKQFIPPIFLKLRTLFQNPKSINSNLWFGKFNSWEAAKKDSSGYNAYEILEKVKESLLKVKNGEAIYERDSVLFDKIEYSWPLLTGLMWVAAQNNGNLNVLDFGGSLGSTYFQNRLFLKSMKNVNWNIVEQELFVKCGKDFFESEELKFFKNIENCLDNQKPNLILLSCVLPYVEKPYELLSEIISYGFKYIIFDRMPFFEKDIPHRITIHKVDPQIYKATIPTHIFNKFEFVGFLEKRFELISDFDSELEIELSDGTRITNKGFIYRIKP